MPASSLELEGVRFGYARAPVLADLSLEVAPGSLFALLGPSGSGKSTLLSIVAGLLQPDAGAVRLDGQDITGVPPERRGMGVVFQSYALFPNLSALDNVAFGLRRQGLSREKARQAARDVAGPLGLRDLLQRHPHELSGGQQQRVALARAVAMRPRLLLLDEPLSNIDPALRAQVRVQLREWLAAWNVTTVLVTHDREDAFWLADRLGLLRDGRLVQHGTPLEVYREPVDASAAEMLGPVNRLPVRSRELPLQLVDAAVASAWALVRPEQTILAAADADGWPVRIEQCVHLGAEPRVLCRLEDGLRVWAGRVESLPDVGADGRVRVEGSPWIVSS
jgi:ABC-type Fe3+/spermidine/putrescine transport system ATPase subunit